MLEADQIQEESTIEVDTVRLSIASKILATLAALVLLFASVAGWAGWQSLQVQRQLQITVDQHMARLSRLSELGNQLLQLRRTEKDISIDMSLRAQGVPKRIEHFGKLSDATRTMAKELVPRGDPAEDAALDSMSTALTRYLDGMAGPVAAVKRQEVLEMAVFEMDIDAPKKSVRIAEEATAAAMAAVRQRVAQERGELDQRLRHMQAALAGGLLLTLVLSCVAAVVLLRNLRRPIAALGEGIERLKNGETGHRVPSFGHDELGQMTEHFNDMASRLTKLIAEVRAASQSIASASAKVAQGNAELSERTERTASSLQQTVATMDQLTGAVRQSADAAHEASELAESAEQACERGGVVVTSAVEGMDGMRHSSQQIAEIIGLIDTIAFQTNILALNAAVEAARAGDEGRGFAVVAAEVRGLASRSAEAASDIKRLIQTSLEQVDVGATRVIEAGSLMSELLDHVRRVRAAMEDISRAAREQRDDISQVHHAMNQLDEATRQNAALVVQSSEAARSMSQQADGLAQSVEAFARGRHPLGHSLQPA